MPKGRVKSSSGKNPPALTPQAREDQVILAAYDLAEKQIREGTASAMVITHFLRLGSQKDRLERELLAERTKLANAKTIQIQQADLLEERYNEIMDAIKCYSKPFTNTEEVYED